jgi:transposase-like protein
MTRSVKKYKRYTDTFKNKAINLASKLSSISKASEELNISFSTLYKWVNASKTKHKNLKSNKNPDINEKQLIREIIKSLSAYLDYNKN